MSERVCLGKEDETRRYDNKAVEQELNNDGDLVICRLSDNRCVVVDKYRSSTMVSIREFYEKDGKQLPTITGVNMSPTEWATFKSNIPPIEEAILQLKGKTRSEHDAEKIGAVSEPSTSVTPPKFPIEPARFDGKNYIVWARQMELLLQHFKIAYVLFDQCPLGPESAQYQWMSDDHICRQFILLSLSDRVFNEYSKKAMKAMSASELWKELQIFYFLEEFGDKRSRIKKYMEFKMDEKKSVIKQVEELNNLADSIASAGMQIDEYFHVSVIISKLPQISRQNLSQNLNDLEYLTLPKLMDRLSTEEQSHTEKNSQLSGVSSAPSNPQGQVNHSSKMGDPKLSSQPLDYPSKKARQE